jgi:hypothetical protein
LRNEPLLVIEAGHQTALLVWVGNHQEPLGGVR